MNETASWVVREKASKVVLFETFNASTVAKLNTQKYEALPIHDYLIEVNQVAKG